MLPFGRHGVDAWTLYAMKKIKQNMKSEIEKCIAGKLFNSAAPEILKIIKRSRKLTHTYNAIEYQKQKKKRKVLKKLLGSIGKNVNIDIPFHCDYGSHIETGNNVIIGMNCTFVDCNKIIIGNNVLIASNVQIYTSTHPTNKNRRLNKNWKKEGLPFFRTFALPVKINDNVWIGGGVIILPGVEIGKNSIIGAGSLVNKSIPANSIAIGNPCKVIKNLKEENK